MKRTTLVLLLFALLAALFMQSCNIDSSTTPIDNPPGGGPGPGEGADDADVVKAIIWHNWNNCANAEVVMTLKSATFNRNPVGRENTPGWVPGMVTFEFSGNPWQHHGSGPGDKDGIWLNFFWWNAEKGAYEGGKFEWGAPAAAQIPTDGSLTTYTTNIQGGYNGLSIPPSGTKIAWMWSKAFSSTERSNLVYGVWP